MVLVALLTTLAVVAAGTRMMKPVYSASSMVRLSEVRTGPVGYSDLTYSEQLQNTYVELMQSRPYLDTVIQQLKLNISPETLATMINVEALPTTELIQITANDGNPEQAAAIANQLAVRALAQPPTSYTISIVESATVPTKPIRPQPMLYLAVAGLVGLVGGLGLAFLFENLDRTIHTATDLGKLAGAPLLGSIPSFSVRGKKNGQAVLLNGVDGAPAGEAFRVLSANTAARMTKRAQTGHSATVLIASAETGTGKSTVLSNLATALAREGQRVIVVGANLRHPDLAHVFGISDRVFQNKILSDPRDAVTALVNTGVPNVWLLPASILSATLDLPPAFWMRELFETLGRDADVMMVDSPAILTSADTTTLAPLVDGVLLVAARDETTDRDLELARTQIEAVGGRILGIVFNKAELSDMGNIYAAPVGRRVLSTNGHSARTKTMLAQVTSVEARGARSKTVPSDANHTEKLEKAG